MSTEFPITIFHNPDCGTSRNALAMIEAAGYAPTVVEYRKVGWTRSQLEGLFAAMGATPRALLREKEPIYAELDLANPRWSDEELLEQIERNPILLNRPIVVTEKGAALCRPADKVLELLPGSAGA